MQASHLRKQPIETILCIQRELLIVTARGALIDSARQVFEARDKIPASACVMLGGDGRRSGAVEQRGEIESKRSHSCRRYRRGCWLSQARNQQRLH